MSVWIPDITEQTKMWSALIVAADIDQETIISRKQFQDLVTTLQLDIIKDEVTILYRHVTSRTDDGSIDMSELVKTCQRIGCRVKLEQVFTILQTSFKRVEPKVIKLMNVCEGLSGEMRAEHPALLVMADSASNRYTYLKAMVAMSGSAFDYDGMVDLMKNWKELLTQMHDTFDYLIDLLPEEEHTKLVESVAEVEVEETYWSDEEGPQKK
eukprot:GFYU01016291.1.p1 GENE.GFYU01016291.1~~GFYU01016291.1.p1  ORF type:complete len:211 (+),score=55.18 GFYU01016291.1:2-634(+)